MKRTLPACVLLFFAATLSLLAGVLGVGSTREEVIDVLGKPKSAAAKNGVEMLFYSGGEIDLRSGKVVRIDQGFDEIIKERAKGLVKYDGRWIAPEEAARLDDVKRQGIAEEAKAAAAKAAAAGPVGRYRPGSDPGAKVQVVANGGKRVELNDLLVEGKVTIVDFYADWCGPCKKMAPALEDMARDGDVYLRKVDIVNWHSEVAGQYDLHSIPNVRVFDRNGGLVGQPTYDVDQVRSWVQQAK